MIQSFLFNFHDFFIKNLLNIINIYINNVSMDILAP